MSAIRPRDLLSESLLDRLGGTTAEAVLAGNIATLAEAGYLNVALPPAFGGLGCTLRQAACGQRRLARHDARAALAVSAHLYWTGAAADAYRAGDESVRWILDEAARGALFAGGHGETGADLRFADPRSQCEPAGDGGYLFRGPAVLSTSTPAWDWIAVHGVHVTRTTPPRSVLAFAGRGARYTPAFRVARVSPIGTPDDIFTTSALTWGHSILASVEYSAARRAFNDAITAYAQAATADETALTGGRPRSVPRGGEQAGQGEQTGRPWPAAEAALRLDAMKARIAAVTHPWQLVQEPTPDLGGQHLIGLHAMRHEIADGAAAVHDLINGLTVSTA
jgi:alkylation response protein AidB-like acyl-CoA dehydrogenase